MERKRCQVCDGPVVNGRCKLCGMPYRNDETLYHLNENRSDHYRHATSRARAMMRQEEIPLGDKKTGNTGTYKANVRTGALGSAGKQTASGSKNVNAGSSYSKLNTSGNKGPGNSYNKQNTAANRPGGASASINRPGMGSSYSQNKAAGSSTYTRNYGAGNKGGTYAKTPARKKNSWLGWLIMIVVICSVVPGLRDGIQEGFMQEFGYSFSDMFGASYEMQAGDTLVVGGEIEAGYYTASCDKGIIYFTILGKDGENGRMSVTEDEECKITLNEGDMIHVVSADPEDAVLQLTLHGN